MSVAVNSSHQEVLQEEVQPNELYLVLDSNPGDGGSFTIKVGTCEHCVVREQGRPARAWDAKGDSELDFKRDQLIARMAAYGVQVKIKSEFVCP